MASQHGVEGATDQARAAEHGESITGRTAITAEDFKAIWAVLPQNRSVMKVFGLMVLSVPALSALSWLTGLGGATPPSWVYFASPLVLAPLIALGLWKGRARWAENAVKDIRSLEGVEFIFDAAGVTVALPGRRSSTAWESLSRCLETSAAFAIYLTPNAMMVVPKRAFAAADQPRLRALLQQRVPNRPLRGVYGYGSPLRGLALWTVLVVVFLVIWQILSSK